MWKTFWPNVELRSRMNPFGNGAIVSGRNLRESLRYDTIDILVQKRRNKEAAKRFFRKLLKGQCVPPWRMVTDKLKSYSAAHREMLLSVTHSTKQYENNRAELSHEPTRQRERQMRRFKSMGQAQRFLTVHGAVGNLFRLGRHLIRATHYCEFRAKALSEWQQVTCAC